jgi:hypothetical protein
MPKTPSTPEKKKGDKPYAPPTPSDSLKLVQDAARGFIYPASWSREARKSSSPISQSFMLIRGVYPVGDAAIEAQLPLRVFKLHEPTLKQLRKMWRDGNIQGFDGVMVCLVFSRL